MSWNRPAAQVAKLKKQTEHFVNVREVIRKASGETIVADAIASRLGEFKGNKNAIAETIENNVRSKIIREHLNDPTYYEKMSALLDEIIADRKAKAVDYEGYLKRIADIAQKVEVGHADDTPAALDTPGKRALYNNLGQNQELALAIDKAVKTTRPDSWRGVQPRERQVKKAIYDLLKNVDDVERIFVIIKAQKEY
jgi:type I restriction enzyme R subunit